MAAQEEKIMAMRKKKAAGPKPVPGSKGWGSIRAAEYGIPSLAIAEAIPNRFGPKPFVTEDEEEFAYDDTSKTGKTGVAGGGGPRAIDMYTRQLQKLLTGGAYAKPYSDLEAKLGELYGQAQPRIDTAMTNLETTLKGMTNPYANFQAQTTQVTPQLSQLLASQGVSQTPLQELAAVTNAQNAGQSTAFGNLVGTLKSIQDASQQGMLQDVASQRTDFGNALEQARLGMGAQIAQQRMGQQESLMKLLLSALAKGGRPGAGRLF